MSFRTLLVDGEYNLRRNFKKRENLFTFSGEHCGGVYGFIETLGYTINKTLPDRVIVMWDGDRSGLYRHEIYPLYKANHKSWDEESYLYTKEELDDKLRSKISCSNQKRKTKNFIDNLFIRQAEVDLIEGDDLIALYIKNKLPDEKIIIFSKDHDYHQLISDDVSVLMPGNLTVLTPHNFKSFYGYIYQNSLLFKCIDGDESDDIPGISGVGIKTVLKLFPKFADEEYTIDRIMSEAFELFQKKETKTLKSIMLARDLLNRNYKLMDLKNPFINEQAESEIEIARDSVMAKEGGQIDRSIQDVMKEMIHEGYVRYMYREDINAFLFPYHRISSKEKEYTKKRLLENNNETTG